MSEQYAISRESKRRSDRCLGGEGGTSTTGDTTYCGLIGRVSGGMVFPRAEARMSVASRFRLVSSFFALTTHQTAVLRYQCAWD